jgi:D-aminopeptidase
MFVGNAFGKLAGSTQVQELGTIETPIVLTNTLNVGTAVEAVVAWTLAQSGNESVASVNALIGETNDLLNDISGMHVHREHVLAAINGAEDGREASAPVPERYAFSEKAASALRRRTLPQASKAQRISYSRLLSCDREECARLRFEVARQPDH